MNASVLIASVLSCAQHQAMFSDVRQFVALSWSDGMTYASHGSSFLPSQILFVSFTSAWTNWLPVSVELQLLGWTTVPSSFVVNDLKTVGVIKKAPCNTNAEGYEHGDAPAKGFACPVPLRMPLTCDFPQFIVTATHSSVSKHKLTNGLVFYRGQTPFTGWICDWVTLRVVWLG